MSFAKFQFIGNLTRDTEYNPDSDSPAILSLAIDADHMKDGVKVEATDFFRVKCFNALAVNAAKYLGKGSKIYVEGRIKPTVYENPPGNKIYGTDYIATYIDYQITKEPGNN
jgi:single-strand DNA-binding protein